MRPNNLWNRPDDGAARSQDPGHPGCQQGSSSVDPFEEKEEGIRVAATTSDVVKVKGKDPDTPGHLKSVSPVNQARNGHFQTFEVWAFVPAIF